VGEKGEEGKERRFTKKAEFGKKDGESIAGMPKAIEGGKISRQRRRRKILKVKGSIGGGGRETFPRNDMRLKNRLAWKGEKTERRGKGKRL